MCSSYRIQMVCVEVWGWRTLFLKRCWLYGQKVPSVCQCIQSASKKTSKSKFSQMWLPTLWEMWDTLYPHCEDHWWNWWNNDYSPTLKGVFRSFWIAWFTTEWSINESSFNANSSWRPIVMPITLACLEKALHPKIIM